MVLSFRLACLGEFAEPVVFFGRAESRQANEPSSRCTGMGTLGTILIGAFAVL